MIPQKSPEKIKPIFTRSPFQWSGFQFTLKNKLFLNKKGAALNLGIFLIARLDTPFGHSASAKTGHRVRSVSRRCGELDEP
jgi:hypothetical protein